MIRSLHRIRLIAAPVLLLSMHAASGEENGSQFIDSFDGKVDLSGYLAENAFGFLPVPTIITEPALGGFGIGLFGLFFHEDEEERDRRMEAARKSEDAVRYLLPPSVTGVGGAYTANNSWLVGAGHMAFWKEDGIRYRIGGGYGDINLDFYGTSDIQFQKPLELKNQGLFFNQQLLFRIARSKFLLGVQQNFTRIDVTPKDLTPIREILPPDIGNALLPIIEDRLTSENVLSGLGLAAQFDSRDNFFNPRKGYHYSFDYLWYNEGIGSDFNYSRYTINGLNYWPIGKSFLSGLRLVADWVDSDELLPFYALPFVSLRGIPAMRYQGDYVVTGEVEFTWLINLRWSLLGFTGAARTADDAGDLKDGPSYTSRGAGFRYLIARRYGMNMGLDVASGPEDTVVYIQVGSSW